VPPEPADGRFQSACVLQALEKSETEGSAAFAAAFRRCQAFPRSSTDEQGNRLVAGIRKELADHLRDYGRALTRHTDAIHSGALRRLDGEQQRIADAGIRIDADGRQRLAGARRDLDHVAALLAASDPRRRGWVLPTDDAGAVVRSALQVAVGDHVTLSFHDGAAGAVIDTVPDKEQT
jgi:exonuclease VII large subunit